MYKIEFIKYMIQIWELSTSNSYTLFNYKVNIWSLEVMQQNNTLHWLFEYEIAYQVAVQEW